MTIDLYAEKQKTIAFLQEKRLEVQKIVDDLDAKIEAEIDACKNLEEGISKKIGEPLEEPKKVEIEEHATTPEDEPEVIHFTEEEIVEEPKCENKPVEPAKTLERPKYRQPEKEAPIKHIKGFRIAGGR